MTATRAKATRTLIEHPPNPETGRNHRIAWTRGFDWRCWYEEGRLSRDRAAQFRYHQPELRVAFLRGWDAADALIQRELADAP